MTRSYQRIAFVVLLACSACKSVASDNADQGKQGSTGGPGGSGESNGGSKDSSGGKGGDDEPSSSTGSGGGGAQSSEPSAGGKGGTHASGGTGGTSDPGDPPLPADDAGVQPGTHDPDAGTMQEPPDAGDLGDAMVGMIGTESCCSVHDSPGCSNADLQVCVCEKISSCCTDKWDQACVLIVTERRCQEGIRDCVCLDGPNQWGQHVCCDSSWGSTCDSTARNLCGAKRGCF